MPVAIRIEFDRDATSEDALRSYIAQLGMRSEGSAAPAKAHDREEHAHNPGEKHDHDHGDEAGHDHQHGGIFGSKTELIFALLCGALLAIGFGIETLLRLAGWVPGRDEASNR